MLQHFRDSIRCLFCSSLRVLVDWPLQLVKHNSVTFPICLLSIFPSRPHLCKELHLMQKMFKSVFPCLLLDTRIKSFLRQHNFNVTASKWQPYLWLQIMRILGILLITCWSQMQLSAAILIFLYFPGITWRMCFLNGL